MAEAEVVVVAAVAVEEAEVAAADPVEATLIGGATIGGAL